MSEGLGNISALARRLQKLAPDALVIDDCASLAVYESDGLTARRQRPPLVVLPARMEEAAAILRFCHQRRIKLVPRGAGTSLSGGALPLADGIVLGTGRMARLLELDAANGRARVEPGIANLAVSHAAKPFGLYYAPDPSSQIACTIGGNVAENSGGVHCLKYGLTSNNILGLKIILPTGEMLELDEHLMCGMGYDLPGLLGGSEGLLAFIAEITLRLLPLPQSVQTALFAFAGAQQASKAVAAIISAGLIPAGMEMMDAPALKAAEAYARAGYPLDAGAILLVEMDGMRAEAEAGMARACALAQEAGAEKIIRAQNLQQREKLWAGRKSAFPAVGRLAPDYYCMDGTIPRHCLAEVLEKISAMSRSYRLAVANVFHAGDGNLHPLILYDASKKGELQRAEAFGSEILKLCVAVGGVLTGEHGVGVEKAHLMDTMFTQEDLEQQQRVKCAFDSEQILNPGKMFPHLRRCAELGRMHVHHGRLPFAALERF